MSTPSALTQNIQNSDSYSKYLDGSFRDEQQSLKQVSEISLDSSIKEFKQRLLNRNEQTLTDLKSTALSNQNQQQQYQYNTNSTDDVNNKQEYSFLQQTPQSKQKYELIENSNSKSDLDDRCQLLKNKMNKMRKAIDNYKEYKSEQSFSVHSQNSSRFIDERMQTPKHSDEFADCEQFASNQYEIIKNASSPSLPSIQLIQDYDNNFITSPQQKNQLKLSDQKCVFEYQSKRTVNDAPIKVESCKSKLTSSEEFSDLTRNLFETDFRNHDLLTPTKTDRFICQQSPEKKLINAVTGAILSLKNLQLEFCEGQEQSAKTTQRTVNDDIYSQNSETYRLMSSPREYNIANKDSLVQQFQAKIKEQSLIINQREQDIQQLLQNKDLLERALDQANEQIQVFANRGDSTHKIFYNKEQEILKLSKDLEESQFVKNNLENQIENLQQQLQQEIDNCKEESAKVKEMEDVINVCKDQITSFDQINFMSQCVIERLERQVGEYKFELEQAKDTIEKQHNMYHQLVKTYKRDEEQITVDYPRIPKAPSFKMINNEKVFQERQQNENTRLDTSEGYVENSQISMLERSAQRNKSLVKLTASPLKNSGVRKHQQQRLQTIEEKWKIIENQQLVQNE